MTTNIEQLTDDATGNALIQACFRNIHRGHVLAYTDLLFCKPGELSDKRRKEAMEALFEFAALGVAAFHYINRGHPIRDKPTKKSTAKRKQKRKEAT